MTKSKETTHYKYIIMMMIFILGYIYDILYHTLIFYIFASTFMVNPEDGVSIQQNCPMSTTSSTARTELTSIINFHETLQSVQPI
jgi:hypothetical protein